MKYEINNFTTANAKRLKEVLKRIVETDRATNVPTATLKADENLLDKVINNLQKVSEPKKEIVELEAAND